VRTANRRPGAGLMDFRPAFPYNDARMLYIVATPIGNLQDITLRALETLKTVDLIYCEDTRRTKQLLAAYSITTPVDSFHHYSERKIPQILTALKQGQVLAYATDAGTPGIADPAGKLVVAVRTAGFTVTPIPGPSAVTALLSVAGIYANEYTFAGYVPTKKGRQTFIQEMIVSDRPVVCFETAPRLLKFLQQVIDLGGQEKQLIIGRELTKQFEEIRVGQAAEHLRYFQENAPRGELVIALAN